MALPTPQELESAISRTDRATVEDALARIERVLRKDYDGSHATVTADSSWWRHPVRRELELECAKNGWSITLHSNQLQGEWAELRPLVRRQC